MSAPVTVLIVDDQEPFRVVATSVVEATPGFQVVGAVATGEQAVQAAAELRPHVVLMDVVLPGIDGLAATRRICAQAPDTTVVLLSTYDVDDDADAAASCGARRFVSKADFGPDILLSFALRAGTA